MMPSETTTAVCAHQDCPVTAPLEFLCNWDGQPAAGEPVRIYEPDRGWLFCQEHYVKHTAEINGAYGRENLLQMLRWLAALP